MLDSRGNEKYYCHSNVDEVDDHAHTLENKRNGHNNLGRKINGNRRLSVSPTGRNVLRTKIKADEELQRIKTDH